MLFMVMFRMLFCLATRPIQPSGYSRTAFGITKAANLGIFS